VERRCVPLPRPRRHSSCGTTEGATGSTTTWGTDRPADDSTAAQGSPVKSMRKCGTELSHAWRSTSACAG